MCFYVLVLSLKFGFWLQWLIYCYRLYVFIVSLTLGVKGCSGDLSVVVHDFLLSPSHPIYWLKWRSLGSLQNGEDRILDIGIWGRWAIVVWKGGWRWSGHIHRPQIHIRGEWNVGLGFQVQLSSCGWLQHIAHKPHAFHQFLHNVCFWIFTLKLWALMHCILWNYADVQRLIQSFTVMLS